jgi:hypothetical protein
MLLGDLAGMRHAMLFEDATEDADEDANVGCSVLFPIVLVVRDQLFEFLVETGKRQVFATFAPGRSWGRRDGRSVDRRRDLGRRRRFGV